MTIPLIQNGPPVAFGSRCHCSYINETKRTCVDCGEPACDCGHMCPYRWHDQPEDLEFSREAERIAEQEEHMLDLAEGR